MSMFRFGFVTKLDSQLNGMKLDGFRAKRQVQFVCFCGTIYMCNLVILGANNHVQFGWSGGTMQRSDLDVFG